jgi:hypothetical protein
MVLVPERATLLCPDCEQSMSWVRDARAGEAISIATGITCPTEGCAGNVSSLRSLADVARISRAIKAHWDWLKQRRIEAS